jgi:hypothetical protein
MRGVDGKQGSKLGEVVETKSTGFEGETPESGRSELPCRHHVIGVINDDQDNSKGPPGRPVHRPCRIVISVGMFTVSVYGSGRKFYGVITVAAVPPTVPYKTLLRVKTVRYGTRSRP